MGRLPDEQEDEIEYTGQRNCTIEFPEDVLDAYFYYPKEDRCVNTTVIRKYYNDCVDVRLRFDSEKDCNMECVKCEAPITSCQLSCEFGLKRNNITGCEECECREGESTHKQLSS